MSAYLAEGLSRASDTSWVSVGRGVLETCGSGLAKRLLGDGPALVVADERTWAAAGERVARSLADAGVDTVAPLVFPGAPAPHASLSNAETIRARLRESGAIAVAVGSGTLNDLAKLASGEESRPYAVVGTAASMDGYTGFGAPISDQGVKRTLPCPAPRAVVFDLDVAAAAPRSLTASGYGDLSAKIPGGADWLLADSAGVEPIHPLAWRLVQEGVADALADPDALAAGDPDAFEGLVSGLLASGLAMQVFRGTRPASGAEHYFSHLWELAGLGEDLDPPLSHGAKVAVGTLAMLGFYERFMARDLGALDVSAAVESWPDWSRVEADIRSLYSGALADHAVAETRTKYVDRDGLARRLGLLVDSWPRTKPRLAAQLRPRAELAAMLARVGAPSRPSDIGLTAGEVRATFAKAMYYRSRYTVLDVAREAGWFEELVDETFAPGAGLR